MIQTANFLVIAATKADKKSIKRFYKQQKYSASFIGFDHCYLIKINNDIIGSVIISFIESNSQQAFLHALVIDKNFQRLGLATLLVNNIQCNYLSIVCFSNNHLTNFYQKLGFQLTESSVINPIIETRFQQYSQNKPNLLRFIKYSDVTTK